MTGDQLNAAHEEWISFCACAGYITLPDGTIQKWTVQYLANLLGVHRTTLYDWKKIIPDFWNRVSKRREELGGQHRVNTVYAGLYLKAASGNAEAAKIWLANFDPNFKMPLQRAEVDHRGLGDVIQKARIAKAQAIEGEVVNADSQPASN